MLSRYFVTIIFTCNILIVQSQNQLLKSNSQLKQSNDLRDALCPVPKEAIFKVGKKFLLYHLGMPLWQAGFAFADHIEDP